MRRLACLVVLVVSASCRPVSYVELSILETGSMANAEVDGMTCEDSCAGELLAQRMFPGGPPASGTTAPAAFSVTVDFVRLRGEPPMADDAGLTDYCGTPGNCTPIAPGVCTNLTYTLGTSDELGLGPLIEHHFLADDQQVTKDAPSGWVIARVLVDARKCDEIRSPRPTAPDSDDLAGIIGCAATAPIELGHQSMVPMSLVTISTADFCGGAVLRCAYAWSAENYQPFDTCP